MKARAYLAQNLVSLMKKKRLSSQALEAAAKPYGDVGKSTIDRATRCQTPLNIDKIEAVASALGVTPWSLLAPPTSGDPKITVTGAVHHLSALLHGADPFVIFTVQNALSRLAQYPAEADKIAAQLETLFSAESEVRRPSIRFEGVEECEPETKPTIYAPTFGAPRNAPALQKAQKSSTKKGSEK